MRDTVTSLNANQLFSLARQDETSVTLRALCWYVTGLDGYLVSNTHVLHDVTDDRPLVAPFSCSAVIRIYQSSQDIVLSHLGLCFSQVCAMCESTPFTLKQGVAATAVRLGLLARALDAALRHLESRKSFGKKILHHQLVKAHFSESHDLITRRCEELALIEACGEFSYDPSVQHEISTHFTNVSKLMGGHGFLLQGVNTIEHLASLIRAIYAPPDHPVNSYRSMTRSSFMPMSATAGGVQ